MAKYFIDHNLLPRLAHAIRELCSYDKSSEIYALTDKFSAKAKDVDWITSLAEEGSWVIISQDRFKKSNAEKEALRQSGLTVFFLDKQWSKRAYWDKAHNLVRWWPAIMDHAERMIGGSVFKVRWNHGAVAKFEQVRL